MILRATNLELDHMDVVKQDEHNFAPSNSIIREELNTKLTKVTKITHQLRIVADNSKQEKPHQKKLADCASKANEESMSNTFNDIFHQQFSKMKEE